MRSLAPLLSIKNASKHFRDKTAFENVSLSLSRNKILAIAGPNGGGKTTLMRCLMGIYSFDNPKSITYGLNGVHQIDRRRQVAYAPDDDNLIEDLTGVEYLALVMRLYQVNIPYTTDRYMQLLGEVDFPLTALNKLVKSYSHGMRKKLQLVSVLMVESKILLIDEPTNGLDPTATIAVKEVLMRESSRTSILIASHHLAFSQDVADELLILKNTVVAKGSLKSILALTNSKSLEDTYKKLILDDNHAATVS